jgi:hypothetical protein
VIVRKSYEQRLSRQVEKEVSAALRAELAQYAGRARVHAPTDTYSAGEPVKPITLKNGVTVPHIAEQRSISIHSAEKRSCWGAFNALCTRKHSDQCLRDQTQYGNRDPILGWEVVVMMVSPAEGSRRDTPLLRRRFRYGMLP